MKEWRWSGGNIEGMNGIPTLNFIFFDGFLYLDIKMGNIEKDEKERERVYRWESS